MEKETTKAVIKTGGKQFLVAEGDELLVEKLPAKGDKPPASVSFTPLAVTKGSGVSKPSAAKVEAKVLGEEKGDKLIVFKMKSKKRHRTKRGHRQTYTRIKIAKIT